MFIEWDLYDTALTHTFAGWDLYDTALAQHQTGTVWDLHNLDSDLCGLPDIVQLWGDSEKHRTKEMLQA